MSGITNTIKVKLGKRSYPIFIGNNIFRDLPEYLARFKPGKKILIVTNPYLERLYGKKLKGILESKGNAEIYLLSLNLDEKTKTLASVEKIYLELAKRNFERHSSLIALGGGVIGDIVGFAAATYLRGIHYFQIPTTLLSQVDSSVGGKTGVNLTVGKNLVGAFYQPKAVFIDSGTLNSLPKREWLCGLAEVVKYGVIWDRKLFELLEKEFPVLNTQNKIHFSDEVLHKIIRRCCEIKAYIVSHDEKEQNLRAILNYGHTVGHAIETYTKHQFNHGEAVGLGMLAASYLAKELNVMSPQDVTREFKLLQNIGLPTCLKTINISKAIEIMYRDKKVVNGQMRFILPRTIGKVKIFKNISQDIITKALDRLKCERGGHYE